MPKPIQRYLISTPTFPDIGHLKGLTVTRRVLMWQVLTAAIILHTVLWQDQRSDLLQLYLLPNPERVSNVQMDTVGKRKQEGSFAY